MIKLADGSGLKLTVARYFTPSGVSIQAEGIHPDVEIAEVDSDAFTKSIVKNQSTREGDIAGHLKNDREKAEEKAALNKLDLKKGDDEGALAWWKDIGSKKDEKLSPRDKIFKADYQAYQAFSYLKAWNAMKSLTR
ncbi:Peptidase family S41 [compost metagenome]